MKVKSKNNIKVFDVNFKLLILNPAKKLRTDYFEQNQLWWKF